MIIEAWGSLELVTTVLLWDRYLIPLIPSVCRPCKDIKEWRFYIIKWKVKGDMLICIWTKHTLSTETLNIHRFILSKSNIQIVEWIIENENFIVNDWIDWFTWLYWTCANSICFSIFDQNRVWTLSTSSFLKREFGGCENLIIVRLPPSSPNIKSDSPSGSW